MNKPIYFENCLCKRDLVICKYGLKSFLKLEDNVMNLWLVKIICWGVCCLKYIPALKLPYQVAEKNANMQTKNGIYIYMEKRGVYVDDFSPKLRRCQVAKEHPNENDILRFALSPIRRCFPMQKSIYMICQTLTISLAAAVYAHLSPPHPQHLPPTRYQQPPPDSILLSCPPDLSSGPDPFNASQRLYWKKHQFHYASKKGKICSCGGNKLGTLFCTLIVARTPFCKKNTLNHFWVHVTFEKNTHMHEKKKPTQQIKTLHLC